MGKQSESSEKEAPSESSEKEAPSESSEKKAPVKAESIDIEGKYIY